MGVCGDTRHCHSRNGLKDCRFSTAAFEMIFFCNSFVCFNTKQLMTFFCNVTPVLEDRRVLSDTFLGGRKWFFNGIKFSDAACIWGNSCCFLNQNLTFWMLEIERTCCSSYSIAKMIFVLLCSPKKIPGPLKRGGASTCARCGSD